MASGGRFIYKKSNIGSRRKPRSKNDEDDDDDGDEEYVLGEGDEVEESESEYESDVNFRDLSDEESFEFSRSDDDGEITRSKKSKVKRNYKKSRVSDDDDDEIEDSSMPKRRGRERPKMNESRDSDFELDDEDDDEFLPDEEDFDEDEASMFSKRRGGVKNGAKKRRSEVSKTKGRKKGRAVASPARKRRGRLIENDDDDTDDYYFIVKDRVSVGQKRSKSKKARRKRSPVDSVSLDSDYVISDDDFVDKDLVVFNNRRKNSKKAKKTVTARSKGRRKKISLEGSDASDSDFVVSDADRDDEEEEDDFIVKEQVVVYEQQKENKKEKVVGSNKRGKRKRSSVVTESSDSDYLVSEGDDEFALEDLVVVDDPVAGSNKKKRRNRSSVVSESSDSDYLVSEDDESVVKDDIFVDKQRNKSKKARKRRIEPKSTRRRSCSVVDSDSESFNFDDVISEEEVRDLRMGGGLILNKGQPKRILTMRKGEDKGKEKKQADDLGKQVCGICLSEEKKSVIQGLLNCCSHYFCFACIMEWSRMESRCPLCKRRFETITKSGGSDPGFMMRGAVIRVQKRDQVYQPSDEELRGMLDPYENVVCMECQQGGDDNLMLLCDICDSSAHSYCVGLGREVPEGNWYCDCCRSVNDGPSHSQFQDTMPDQEASNSSFIPSVTERCDFTNVSTNSPRPVSMTGRSSSLRIDLNASPRDFPLEDYFVSSPVSGSAASTVLGRRHIRQRIHVILTTNRQRNSPAGTTMLRPNSGADVQNGEVSPVSENPSPLPSALGFEQWHQNPRPFFRSHSNLAPCTFREGSSLRHVDGAKEEVQRMVKSHLINLSQDRVLDRSMFKEIAKSSTHSILAACGIEHRMSMVSAGINPPVNCMHNSDDGPAHLLKGCCSSCFSSFVKDVVHRLIDTAS